MNRSRIVPVYLSAAALLMLTGTALAAAGDATAPASGPRVISVDTAAVDGPLDRFFSACVGSDRAIIHLRPEDLRDLKRVHDECGFRYLRCHGLLNEEMKIYGEDASGTPHYDWKNVDAVYDNLLSVGVRPFVELGFIPEALASGKKHIFWWNGNVTPPKSYERWGDFIKALVEHLTQRYGADEVRRWYFEVWNEPNLDGFWAGSQADYFHLYQVSAAAIKAVDPAYRVGGPATAGAAWVPQFLAFCQSTGSPVDIVTTHTYGAMQGFLDANGKGQVTLDPKPGAIVNDLTRLLAEIRASFAPTLPLWITEWSTSYSPRDPVHDSYVSAAYILQKLRETPAGVAGMSYWTFSDQFEEAGKPPTPFHGGFGLLNVQGLPKPSFYAYRFLNQLGDTRLKCADGSAWACRDDHGVQVLLWDFSPLRQDAPDTPFYTRDLPAEPAAAVHLELKNLTAGAYHLAVYRVGYRHNDVYTAYLDLHSPVGPKNAPTQLPAEMLEQLRKQCDGAPERLADVQVDGGAPLTVDVPMKQNDVCFVKVWR